MAIFDMWQGKVIYIVNATSLDVVIDWGFYATVKKRIHLDDREYFGNIPQEELDKLRLCKQRLNELLMGRQVILRLYKPVKVDKWIGDVFLTTTAGVEHAEKYMEATPAGELMNVKKYLIGQGFLTT